MFRPAGRGGGPPPTIRLKGRFLPCLAKVCFGGREGLGVCQVGVVVKCKSPCPCLTTAQSSTTTQCPKPKLGMVVVKCLKCLPLLVAFWLRFGKVVHHHHPSNHPWHTSTTRPQCQLPMLAFVLFVLFKSVPLKCLETERMPEHRSSRTPGSLSDDSPEESQRGFIE